jgi:hypothetical protein
MEVIAMVRFGITDRKSLQRMTQVKTTVVVVVAVGWVAVKPLEKVGSEELLRRAVRVS